MKVKYKVLQTIQQIHDFDMANTNNPQNLKVCLLVLVGISKGEPV